MKDYASMSDFEINSAVSMLMLGESENPSSRYVAINDYCNNPADAWPVISSNSIGIKKDFDFCCGEFGGYYDTGLWIAENPKGNEEAKNKSALRAAMVVFLMMKESEND